MSQYLTNITGDVFGLNYVYDRQVENIENRNFSNWREDPIYGYSVGGRTPGAISTVIRFDFSNETSTLPDKNLPSAVYSQNSATSSSYGYFSGGIPGRSSIDRLDFSNETISNPGLVLTNTRYASGEASSANYGYFAGGVVGPTWSGSIDRLDFSNETVSSPGKSINGVESFGSCSSGNYGYFGGGLFYSAPLYYVYSRVDRLDFYTENTVNLGNILSVARYASEGTFGLLYGYLAGGAILPPGALYSTIDRLDFSNDTISNGGKLPATNASMSRFQNSKYGYFAGGGAAARSSITRIDFDNGTISTPGANLPTNLYAAGSSSGGGSALKDNKNYGYFAGGFAPPQISTITRLDFSNDTVSNPGKDLPSVRSELASVSSNYHGYFGGGFAPPQISNITRIDFVNETINDSLGNLPSNRRMLAATESGSYGYWTGGFNSPPDNYLSTITRFDFITEIATDTPTNLPFGRREFTATSNNFYAYFGGGYNGTSFVNTISRLDFSNETAVNPGNNLPGNVRNHAVMASTVYGYFAGGEEPAPTPYSVSSIARLDFASETVSSPGNLLSTVRRNLAATASRTYGYFAGGFSPPYVSTVTRIDFSNETVSEPGNVLPSARGSFTGLTNSN